MNFLTFHMILIRVGVFYRLKMDRTRGDNKNSLKFPSQEKNCFPSLNYGSLFLQRFGKIRQLL